jgi:5-methylcytosine-specific restriction protein A
MIEILREPLEQYLINKEYPFKGNWLAKKFRYDYPEKIRLLIANRERYKVEGSSGKGQWARCPWIAIFDVLVTETAQSGFYPVFLFKEDMSGVYLSLNQGVTDIQNNIKGNPKSILKRRAKDFREKLDVDTHKYDLEIDLMSSVKNSELYEAGNIVAIYYSFRDLPNSEELEAQILHFLNLYNQLIYNDIELPKGMKTDAIEHKKIRLHYRVERNGNIAKKIKTLKGYVCEVCDLDFREKYGQLGKNFIEAHHLKPISQMNLGELRIDLVDDFAVLCSNCHRMIHRMDDVSDILGLRTIVYKNAKRENH